MKALRVSASVLKILVGMMFIISAVSKFITIDSFEMYIFSFGLFPLGISFYVARFVLAFELILGASLISHRNHRFAVLMSLLFLLCFVVFLTYAHLVGRTDSCHCFGEMLPFDPVQSILKNAVLVILLLFVYKFAPADWFPRWWLVVLIYLATAVLTFFCMVHSFHALDMLALVMMLVMLGVGILASLPFYGKWYVTTVLILTPIVTTFILTPPDSWFYTNTDERFDEELFLQQLEPAADTADTLAVSATPAIPLQEGRNVVAFFSVSVKSEPVSQRSCVGSGMPSSPTLLGLDTKSVLSTLDLEETRNASGSVICPISRPSKSSSGIILKAGSMPPAAEPMNFAFLPFRS